MNASPLGRASRRARASARGAALALTLALVGASCGAGEEDTRVKQWITSASVTEGTGGSDSTESVTDTFGSSGDAGTGDASSGPWTGTSGPTSQTSLTSQTSQTSQTTVDPTDDCLDPCTDPPSSCHVEEGWCEDGQCVYGPKFEGESCEDGDPCTVGETCDGVGGCAGGDALDCTPPAHAEGGACVDGGCGDFTCIAPWENCDGDWDNGCEIPTGVPNRCDAQGLNDVDGCWTAHCGSLNVPEARNFGTWYCYECSTCHDAGGGNVQWCSHDTGVWFPPDVGGCGTYEDLVCAP